MMKHWEDRGRHSPKWGHRNIPSVPQTDSPNKVRINDDGCHRRLKPVQNILNGRSHLRTHGFYEPRKIFTPNQLRRYNVWYVGIAYVTWLWVWADEAEPFFSDDEGDENIGGFWNQLLAKVHHGVDVASTGIGQRHHVADGGWFSFGSLHFWEFDGNFFFFYINIKSELYWMKIRDRWGISQN